MLFQDKELGKLLDDMKQEASKQIKRAELAQQMLCSILLPNASEEDKEKLEELLIVDNRQEWFPAWDKCKALYDKLTIEHGAIVTNRGIHLGTEKHHFFRMKAIITTSETTIDSVWHKEKVDVEIMTWLARFMEEALEVLENA